MAPGQGQQWLLEVANNVSQKLRKSKLEVAKMLARILYIKGPT
jgi:hypothetical protein